MKALVLVETNAPLQPLELPDPQPGSGEILIRVAACAVCRTDLHVVDGELPPRKIPLVPGHEIVGTVIGIGHDAGRFKLGLSLIHI